MGDSEIGISASALDIINLLMADRVLPMEIGEVASETDVIEDAAMDRTDSEEEVAVDVIREESLSVELADVWVLPLFLGSMDIWVMCRVDFWVGLELALVMGLVNGLESGCESKICTCFSRPPVRRGMATPARSLGGTPTLREVGEGETESSYWICCSISGIATTERWETGQLCSLCGSGVLLIFSGLMSV